MLLLMSKMRSMQITSTLRGGEGHAKAMKLYSQGNYKSWEREIMTTGWGGIKALERGKWGRVRVSGGS